MKGYENISTIYSSIRQTSQKFFPEASLPIVLCGSEKVAAMGKVQNMIRMLHRFPDIMGNHNNRNIVVSVQIIQHGVKFLRRHRIQPGNRFVQ